MRKIIAYILLTLTMTFTASADNDKLLRKQFKKDISTVKSNLKSGRDLEKSETTLRKYLSNSIFYNEKNVHLMLIECIKKQYDAINEQMYLKQRVDTAKFLRTNVRLFLAVEAFDSLDARPDSKGRIEPSYRKKHAEYLMPYWGNILKGGIFFYAHSNWKEAWQCFDTYLDCYRQPLFSYEKMDSTQYNFASFLATMSAYNLSNLSLALKYADKAISYTPRREMVLQTLADLCAANNDTINYLRFLKDGNKDYPYSRYFFPNLIDFYAESDNYSQALQYANMALAKDSLNTTFLLARHNILMLMRDYDKALKDGISLININDTLAIPNYNVACIYYEKAQNAMVQKDVAYKQRMKNAQEYYKACLPYMERYRKLRPKDIHLWKPVLYDVYLNLNMGKEFDGLLSL